MAKFKPDQKKLKTYVNKIEVAENHRDSNYRDKWTKAYKRWRNHVDTIIDKETNKPADRSNISIPYTFVQVETILPRLVETLFASRPYVSVKNRKAQSKIDPKKSEVLLDYQMNEVMDFQDLFTIGLKTCAIYGTTVAYVGWRLEQKPVIKKESMPVMDFEVDGNGEPMLDKDGNIVPVLDEDGKPIPMTDETGQPITELQPVKSKETTYDDPEVKFLDLGLFYVDPHAEDIDDARYCGHDEFKTKAELDELVQQGIYQIDWKKIAKEKNSNKAREERMNAVGLSSDKQNTDGDDDLYRVTHYYEDDKHVVLINRSWIAKDGSNPFWHKRKPYKKEVYTLVPGEFYGIGIPEILEDLQDELNTERNMRIDYRKFAMIKRFKIRKGTGIDRRTVSSWRMGTAVEVENMDDLEEISLTDAAAGASFNEESSTKQDMQDATGGHDVVMGTANSSETATTTMTKDNNASMRFKLLISRIEKKLLVGISRLMLQLDQQFIDDEREYLITGEDGNQEPYNITPEEIQGEYELVAAGSSVEPMANKEAYKQRLVELYGLAKNDPIISQFPNKLRNLLKKVIEAFDIKDVDNILPTDEELTMMQQQQAEQARIQAEQEAQDKQTEMMMKYNKGGSVNTAPMQEMGVPMMGSENVG